MIHLHKSFAWAEVAPGVWQRDVDEVETFWAQAARIYNTQGRRPYALTGHVSLKIGVDSPTSQPDINIALRKAWCRIRQDHPSVASVVDYDFDTERFTRSYRTLRDATERDSWLSSTFIEISNGQSGVEFANSDPPAPDLPTLFVLKPPSDSDAFECRDLVFRAPHDTIDGVGTLLLLNNLLEHASHALEQTGRYPMPEFNGTEVQDLSPPYRTAAAVPQQLTSALKGRVDKMASEHVYFSKLHSREPKQYLSPPFKHGAQAPGRHQRTEATLDPQQSSKILAACKALDATVTHALNAVVPLVLRNLTNEDDSRRMTYFRFDLLRNLRPFCAEPFNSAKHPVTAYHGGSCFVCELEIAPKTSEQFSKDEFQQLSREVSAFYRRVADDVEHGQLAPNVWAGWLRSLPKIERDPAVGPPPSPNPGVTLSSLGRVDGMLPPKIGLFSVSKPWITGEEMGNGYGLFLLSHEGQLNLAAAYNDAWQTEEAAQDFLQACIRVLCTALDLEI